MQNVVEKLVSDPFLKNEDWAYLCINSLKFSIVSFHCIASWGLSKYIETKLQLACFHLILSFFKKCRGLELVTLPHFLHNIWRKIFLLSRYLNWRSFIVWLSLLCEISGNMCIGIVCKPGCDVMNFEANLTFLIKLLFLHDQNVVTRELKYLENDKSF